MGSNLIINIELIYHCLWHNISCCPIIKISKTNAYHALPGSDIKFRLSTNTHSSSTNFILWFLKCRLLKMSLRLILVLSKFRMIQAIMLKIMILAGTRLRRKLSLESSRNFGILSKNIMIGRNKTRLTLRIRV